MLLDNTQWLEILGYSGVAVLLLSLGGTVLFGLRAIRRKKKEARVSWE